MENSNLSLRQWLMAMTYISATKQGFSSLELQRKMGFSRYQTVFDLYHTYQAEFHRVFFTVVLRVIKSPFPSQSLILNFPFLNSLYSSVNLRVTSVVLRVINFWLRKPKGRQEIRIIMGMRDDEYKLEVMVEYDEAYVTKVTSSKQKKGLSGGWGSRQKSTVAVMAESTVLEDFKKTFEDLLLKG